MGIYETFASFVSKTPIGYFVFQTKIELKNIFQQSGKMRKFRGKLTRDSALNYSPI